MLAAMISSPTAYDPITNPDGRADAAQHRARRRCATRACSRSSDEDFQALLDTPVPTKRDIEPPTDGLEGPLLHRLAAPAGRRQVRRRPGLRRRPRRSSRRSTYGLQQAAEQAVSDNVGGLGPTSAVVAIDNGSGEVLAMVGGQDFNDSPFNLATNGQRQPGSSFKPFTLVTALREGHSPDETFESAPQALPFEATIRTKNGKKKEVDRLLPGQQLRRQLPRHRLDRDRDHLLRQLGLRAARPRGRDQRHRQDRARDGHQLRSSTTTRR